MKASARIFQLVLCSLVLFSCTKERGEEDTSPVMVRLSAVIAQMQMDASAKSESEIALDPQVENLIVDLWILQYNRVGEISYAHFEDLTVGMPSVNDLRVPLKRGESTIVVFANLGVMTQGSDWKWPGTLAGLRSSVIASDYNLDRDSTDPSLTHVPEHLFMVGEETVNVTEETTEIGIMLSRLCCKLRIAISQKEDEFENLQIRILNGVHGFTVFPTDDEFSAANMSDYDADVIGEIPVSSRIYRYYYMYENLDSDPDLQTKIEVVVYGKTDHKKRTRVFPITKYGKIYRNTFYNYDLVITGKGGGS